jgi:hypothetical protein
VAGAVIRPPAPFFSPSSRGRPSFGVGNPKICSGYVGLAAGFSGTYCILVRDLPGLRDDPKNCSGYCTREELGKQPGVFRLEIPPAWEQTEQLFGLCPGAGAGDFYKLFYLFVLTYNIMWDNVGLV